MTTNDIDWSLAPEGTKDLRQDIRGNVYFAKPGYYYCITRHEWIEDSADSNVIAKPPQRKTVEDAAEYYNGVWPKPFHKYLHYMPEAGNWLFQSSDPSDECLTLVCTREEFEKCAEKQKESDWTHEWDNSAPRRLRIVCDEPDIEGRISIYIESIGYSTCLPSQIRPIKPTINHKQAWLKLTQEGYTVARLQDEFDITD